MEKLTKRSADKLLEDLKGQVIETPDGEYQIMPLYLSGNIREKLVEAKKAAENDPKFNENVTALESAMPKAVPANDIAPALGASWIAPRYVSQFIREALGAYNVKVSYDKTSGTWSLEKAYGYAKRWSTANASTHELLESALNMRTVTIRYKDSDGTSRIDSEATQQARAKQGDIKNEFVNWIFNNKARRDELAETYNELFNNHRNLDYEEMSKYITLEGISPDFTPRLSETRSSTYGIRR